MREGVPFSLKSIEDIITEEKEELLSLLYEEVEDDLNYRVKLDIEVQLVAKLPEKEYEENELSYREIYFMNDFDEYVDEDNINDVLNKAVEEIQEDIEEDQDKDSIIGIQAFHFKLVIIEDIYYLIMILLELWIIKMGLLRGLVLLLSFVLFSILSFAWFVLFVCWVVVLFWVWNG